MEFKRTIIRTLSILGQRGAFGYALTEIAKENDAIIALTADLCTTSGLDRFNSSYPERLVNVGIAEQNMVGIAAGISTMKYIPFATTFANFASLRSCEQMRHFMGYMKENIKIVGLAGGFAMGMFGTTHYGLEDIAVIRAIPNITILSPSDCLETAKATIAASQFNGPVYLRLTGVMNHPMIYKEDYEFEIGKAIQLKDGNDIAIFATGGMVYQSLQAANQLEEQGFSCKVVNVHTIKPMDKDAINKAIDAKLIVTVEEHSVIGGLGSTIAEALSGLINRPPQLMIGVSGEYKMA
ncbi:MAG TPA: transketolase C-terminal domain-containing protein, partial [Anaerovoracaceae bacterium]|nr:transketolase C-terminal domain-containing protein [Anaerovoracaceae bacterium]